MKIYPIANYTNYNVQKQNKQNKNISYAQQNSTTNNSVSFGSWNKVKTFFLSTLLALGGCGGYKCSKEMDKLGVHKADNVIFRAIEAILPSKKVHTKIVDLPDGTRTVETPATHLYIESSIIEKCTEDEISNFWGVQIYSSDVPRYKAIPYNSWATVNPIPQKVEYRRYTTNDGKDIYQIKNTNTATYVVFPEDTFNISLNYCEDVTARIDSFGGADAFTSRAEHYKNIPKICVPTEGFTVIKMAETSNGKKSRMGEFTGLSKNQNDYQMIEQDENQARFANMFNGSL